MQSAEETRGLWLGFLGVVMFAIGLPMLRLAVGPADDPQLSPEFVAAGRAALAGVLSVFYLWFTRAPALKRRDVPELIVSALGTVVGFPLFASLALRHVEAMHAAVVVGLLPLTTTVVAALYLRHRPSPGFWACAVAGCATVIVFAAREGGGSLSSADGWLLLAVIASSIGYVVGAQLCNRMTPEQVICWVLIVSLPLTIPVTLASWPTTPIRPGAWMGVIYNAVFAMWLAYFAWYRGLALGGTVRVSQVQLMQPFFALLFAVPLLGEQLELTTVAYSIAVIAIVFIGRKMPVHTRPTILLAAIAVVMSGSSEAAESERIGNATVAELRTLFEQAAAATGTVGAQVSAIVGDQRIDFAYGTANAELNVPMTVDTVVQIGSTTKMFNAATVMTLVDEGKMAIDTPITQYLPQLKLAGGRPADDVTLRRLLSMSAGLDMGPTKSFRGDDALGQFVAALSDLPFNYPTGHGFGYSNASVCVSAFAAERVAGQPWDTLLRKRVLEPAGITHFVNLAEDLAFQRVAVGHTLVKKGEPVNLMRPWIADQGAAPAGLSVAISAHDLALFGQLFINGGKAANGNRVLSEAAVKNMMTPTTKLAIGAPQWGVGDEWGLGPTTAKWGKTVVWGHGGSNMGGSSQLLWFPEKRAVLAFTMNSPMAFEPFSIRMTGDFAQALLGVRAPAAAKADRPVRVDRPERLVGTYVRYGVRYEITERKGKLHYQEFNEFLSATYKEMKIDSASSGPLVDTDLLALGGDRFLVSFPGFENGIPVFFYGKDEKGRATNITSGLRTGGRMNANHTARVPATF